MKRREEAKRGARSSAWVAGVDGCPGGWMVVLFERRSRETRVVRVSSFEEILRLPERPARIGIDMPIGLYDRAVAGGRACDRAARTLLGHRRSTLFSAPSRTALDAARRGLAFAAVCAAERAASPDGVGLSQQAFHLLPKIDELDRCVDASLQARVFEVHPELAFAVMNGGAALEHPKKTLEGRARRLALLQEAGFFADLASARPPRGAKADDLVDAFAACFTALRHGEGEALAVPDTPERDARGLAMAIWR